MNQWVRESAMPEIAERLGLDALPLRNNNFNFYHYAGLRLKPYSYFRGEELDYQTGRLLSEFFFPESGRVARAADYERWVRESEEEGRELPYFDDFFRVALKPLAYKFRNEMSRKKRLPHGSLTREEGEGGVSETALWDKRQSDPHDVLLAREERREVDEALRAAPMILAREGRHSQVLVPVLDMWKQGYTNKRMAEELNAQGIATSTGGQWRTSTVDRLKDEIAELLNQHMGRRDVDWDSVIKFGLGSQEDL
jgi:hypothetical protein